MGAVANDRVTLVAGELCALGLSPQLAASVASDFTIRYPVARRSGVRVEARRLERKGIAPDTAETAAAMLLAMELWESGRDFGDIVRLLESWELRREVALTAALDAARLHRSLQEPEREQAGSFLAALVLALTFAASAALALHFALFG